MKRIFCFVIPFVMLICICACGQKTPESFQGVVLKAPSDVRISLMSGFQDGAAVAPTETYTQGEYNYYRFTGLEGAYRCVSSGLGYYTVTKNIVVTAQDNQKETLLDVTPAKMAGTGWEPSEVTLFADTLLNGAFADDLSLWPEYSDAFTTPWFTQERGAHQITTQTQMEEYLQSLDDEEDDLYLFSAGMTGAYRYDIPLAVLTKTDLTGVTTLEEMAKALENEKPTVFYRAQVHGIEPASGEAALAVIGLLDNRWNDYLEDMNVCIIPRSTPDSAQNFTRYVGSSIEPNQDSLRLKTHEVRSFIALCNLLTPEVVVDGHEYQCHVPDTVVEGGDILVGIGYTIENSKAIRNLGLEMADGIFSAMKKNGLTSRYYVDVISTNGSANGARTYAGNMGSIFFLLESRGIGMGTDLYPRRIISHVTSMESLLTFICENKQKVMDTVAEERSDIIRKGSTYTEDDRILLKAETQPNEALTYQVVTYDQLTGEAILVNNTPKEMSDMTESVVAPTAYVIPAGESFTKDVLKLLDLHSIEYSFIPEGSKVPLQQYCETGLSEEAKVSFSNGAYVICKNQLQSRNLSQLFEPKVATHGETKGTLVAQGIIDPEEGKYPLYRYIRDLNIDGFIDYQK